MWVKSGRNESPHKAELALLQVSKKLQLPSICWCGEAVKSGPAGDWSELTRSEELNPWMMAEAECDLLQGEAGGQSAQEHRAAGVAEEHRLLAADHRASPRAGRSNTVVCMLSLPPLHTRR